MDISHRTQLKDGEGFNNSTTIYFTESNSQSGIDSISLYKLHNTISSYSMSIGYR